MRNETLVLGITGSVGMGKTTTAGMFKDEGIPVWDADAAVARAYSPGGAAIAKIRELCPSAVPDQNMGVDRSALRTCLDADNDLLDRLERAVHPIVADDREKFLAKSRARRERIVVLDVPLLYEAGVEKSLDAVLVVTVSDEIQRSRVLARDNMTEERFARILSRQIPDEEKKARADYVIETTSEENVREAVRSLIAELQERGEQR